MTYTATSSYCTKPGGYGPPCMAHYYICSQMHKNSCMLGNNVKTEKNAMRVFSVAHVLSHMHTSR